MVRPGRGSCSGGNRGSLDVVSLTLAAGVSFSLDVAGSMSDSVAPGSSMNDFRPRAASSGVAIPDETGND